MTASRTRLAAGRYAYRGRVIVRTDWPGEGRRGGTVLKWELGRLDSHGIVSLDGDYGYRTLRDALQAVDEEQGRDEDAGRGEAR